MTDEIKLKKNNVRKAYKEADEDGKKLIENLCGEEGKGFLSVSICDRVGSFEDARYETGRPPVPEFECLDEDLRAFFKSVYRNVVIVQALNEGERVDIYDMSKPRHYPYMRHDGSPSAFRFYGADCDRTLANAGSGSRLSLLNQKHAEYYGKTFTKDIQDMITL